MPDDFSSDGSTDDGSDSASIFGYSTDDISNLTQEAAQVAAGARTIVNAYNGVKTSVPTPPPSGVVLSLNNRLGSTWKTFTTWLSNNPILAGVLGLGGIAVVVLGVNALSKKA